MLEAFGGGGGMTGVDVEIGLEIKVVSRWRTNNVLGIWSDCSLLLYRPASLSQIPSRRDCPVCCRVHQDTGMWC